MAAADMPGMPSHSPFAAHAQAGQGATLIRGKVGLVCLFVSEAHMFGALLAAYLIYLQDSQNSSTPPGRVLHLPLAIGMTVCLVGSSGTIALAEAALRRGGAGAFRLWWLITAVLGMLFIAGTVYEWNDLIGHQHLTLSTNLFGTTYFPLIGLHATHVAVGVVALLTVLGMSLAGRISRDRPAGAVLVSWYWHFVDAVWIVLFSVVYLASRW